MNYLIIRAYKKDDYLARLCYESWIRSGYVGEVIFYCQKYVPPDYVVEYKPKWIDGIGKHYFHEHKMSNYGGCLGVEAMIEAFKLITPQKGDWIISCDTDIVIKENPLDYIESDTDIAGTGGMVKNDWAHISGQLMVISGEMLSKIITSNDKRKEYYTSEMNAYFVGVCDDSWMSYSIHKKGGKHQFLPSKCWHHTKSYNFEPIENWDNLMIHFRSY